MTNEIGRKNFLSRTILAGAAVAGLPPGLIPGAWQGGPQGLVLQDVPKLDGVLVYDAGPLRLASMDQGGLVNRPPRAVLRPGSIQDVVRMVQYASKHRLPVVMRGRGHSRYGQALAEGGIIIDSSWLNKVREVTAGTIDVEAGASLASLVQAALNAGAALPVMTSCAMLSVGGFLSVGGQSIGSQRYGAFVDQALELEIVTGEGRLLTCSETQERELFEMSLAGLGQCGIIVRAKLRLIPAPSQVTLRTVTYDAIEPFLAHQQRLAMSGECDILAGGIRRQEGGTLSYRMTIGRYGAPGADTDPLSLLRNLEGGTASEPIRQSYRAYRLGEATTPDSAAAAPPRPAPMPPPPPRPRRTRTGGPSLTAWLPASKAADLVTGLLGNADEAAGITSIECTALPTSSFHRPLFRVPAEECMFAFWTLRTAFQESGSSLDAQLAANDRFLTRALPLGAKRYPPYGGGLMTPVEWRDHFGESLYRRFASAKRKHDPAAILTPGPRMFG